MATFVASYDLRKNRSYEPLWTRLGEWGAVRALESLWLISADTTAAAIRDDLVRYIDADDGLVVARLSGEAAWHLLLPGADRFLLRQFAAA